LEKGQQNVLVCPLDWGLGHASRMIPVIQQYLVSGYNVLLGGSGKSGELLKLTFPGLPFICLPSAVIRYAQNAHWFWPRLICQIPGMIIFAFKEHHYIKSIVAKHRINILISDNRYGLFCRKAYCIFVTHQISPVLPTSLSWTEYLLHLVLRTIILQYNECWIPDTPDQKENLSGKLSHRFRIPKNAVYVGILSRFHSMRAVPSAEQKDNYELVIILSGPEPQLNLLLQSLWKIAININRKTLLVTGFNMEYPSDSARNKMITMVSHLDSQEFCQVLSNAGVIICRSGYSSIMDLVALRKEALLIPTPGQPEQEYLAEYLTQKGYFSYVRQDQLDSEAILRYLHERPLTKNCNMPFIKSSLPIKSISDKKYNQHGGHSNNKTRKNLK
jgi:hypothetical protein